MRPPKARITRHRFLGALAATMASIRCPLPFARGAQDAARTKKGLNPAKGVGWRAFTTVVERIRRHLGERVVWMRPSDITDRYQRSGGWEFVKGL